MRGILKKTPKLKKSAERISIPNEKTMPAVVQTSDAMALKCYRSFRELRERI